MPLLLVHDTEHQRWHKDKTVDSNHMPIQSDQFEREVLENVQKSLPPDHYDVRPSDGEGPLLSHVNYILKEFYKC